MTSLKNKIIKVKIKLRKLFSFAIFSRESNDLDKKLVYSLSKHKIPNLKKFKYLNKFLSPKEFLILKVVILVILINVVYLGTVFVKKHLEYVPTFGGTYVEGVVAYPKNINPIYSSGRDTDNDLSSLIYSSLFRYDANGRIVNDLVKNFRISDNGKEYFLQIKDNVRWHNGEELTVEDIVYTFNLIKDPNYNSPLKSNFEGVNIEVVNDNTIKFTLSDPYASFLHLLTFGILPKNIWENISSEAVLFSELNLKPIGSGPYKFKSLTKNKSGYLKEYHLIANDDYYGRKVHIKDLVFRFYPSYPEAVQSLNDNQIDGLAYLPIEQRENVLSKKSLFFHNLDLAQVLSIFFNNNKNEGLKNVKVRKALGEAIDRERISNDLYYSTYRLINGPLPLDNIAYDTSLFETEYNPEEARKVLKDKELKIGLSVLDSTNNILLAKKIKYYWEKVGVDVNIKIISNEDINEVIRKHDFEALVYGQSIEADPDIYSFWHSSQIGNGSNLASYNNKEVDELLVKARIELDKDKRINEYKKIQEKIINDYPVIFLYNLSYTYLQSKRIKGFSGQTIIRPADRFASIANWYRKTKKKFVW